LEKTKSFDIPKRAVWKAYQVVQKNGGAAGIDGQTIEKFEEKLEDNLYKLWNRMSSGSYFPKAVRRVDIPKKSGGTRPLGIPTVSDRIAQMTARLCLERMLEPHFHPDSYGYRPAKSAHDALKVCRERCWKYDWVIDLDIKGFFDTIDHELMLKAVDHHKPPVWVRMYIERWLKAPAQDSEGILQERTMGTPQGGVISPLLANLYLHYAFDMWMKRNHSGNPFERYADDIVIHCRTREEAETLLAEIVQRLSECKLTVHPEKTKMVYCKDGKRKDSYVNTEFDFLGFTFRKRAVWGRNEIFMSFTPAISKKAEKAIRDKIRSWKVHLAIQYDIDALARIFNPRLRGWMEYYGRFRKVALRGIYKMFQKILVKWAKNKYRRFKNQWKRALKYIVQKIRANPSLFIHWKYGW
jgi:RNA-directed DNA polymerase